jgi:hypothetical protein
MTLADRQHRRRHGDDALGAELAAYDALWSLAFGADVASAPGAREER